jgi:glycerol-3-phosphate dehydrogenase
MSLTDCSNLSSLGGDRNCDVAVIGGGVVGCAVARRFALLGARVLLVEKGSDILSGASKANSALLHTGFDAPPGSLELALMQRGYREYLALRDGMNLPLLETGAMVVAWSEAEFLRLDGIAAAAIVNGVDDVRMLTPAEVRLREPGLAGDVFGALLVPGEHVIDPWSAPLAYLTQARAHGAEMLGGVFDGKVWRLETSRGDVRAGYVINCAGLFGDIVEARCLGEASFEIRPRKGQFVVFDKPAAQFLTTTILPVPTDRTKGVVLARTIFGNVLCGPTAEEQTDRSRATVDEGELNALVSQAIRMLPALSAVNVTAIYAGLRPASETKDYRVRHEPAQHFLTLGGIRSTGLTAALGLAAYAADLVCDPNWVPAASLKPVKMPNLAEHLARDWQNAGYGEIVCHCEMVTRREIEAALGSAVPPGDFGGLRRRTRAAMGRCQGFYCGAKLAAMTKGYFASPLTAGG